ncbi:MAG: hypothetical protein NTW17_00305 [Candidatus Pacearchaeota archaeon]|nr:hypothetical protein [Candidatus Pacearchaeota archaeon]
MENTRGLSAIVATLIIILLTLVAVGIIWVVIRNVVQGGAEQIDISTKCVAVSLEAVSVNETSPGVYAVTLHRNAGGDEIGGVKVAVFNATDNSGVVDFGTLTALQTKTVPITTPGSATADGNKIEYTPFFIDASGNEQLCTQTQTFNF